MRYVIGCTTRPYTQLTFAAACEHIAAASYTDVAVFAHQGTMPVTSASTADQIASTRKSAADAGLAPSMLLGGAQLKLGLDAAVQDYKRLIDNAAALGAKWLLDCGTSDEAEFESFFALIATVAPHAQAAGVHITLKPHGGISLSADDLLNACNRVNHPAFAICYDPGNIIYYSKGALRPEDDIAAVAPKVSTVIIKDCVIENGEPNVMVTPGEGLVDFNRVLGGLVAGGFTGPCYAECVFGSTLDQINRNVRATRVMVSDILATIRRQSKAPGAINGSDTFSIK